MSVPPGVPCALEQKHEIFTHKGEHSLPDPSARKALIVVVFGSHFGTSYQHKIAVDHIRWVAVTVKSEYTFFEAEAGTLTLSYYGPAMGHPGTTHFVKDMQMEVEANRTYFMRETITDLSQIGEQEGRSLLPKLDYATFAVKGNLTEQEWIRRSISFLEGWKQLRAGITPADTYALLHLEQLNFVDALLKGALRGFDASHDWSWRGPDLYVTKRGGVVRVDSCGVTLVFDNGLQSWR